AARDLGVAARPHGQTKDSSDEAAARLSPRARSPIDLVEDLCRDGNRGLAMGHGTPLGNTKESTLARRRSTDKSAASRLRVARPLTCAAPGPQVANAPCSSTLARARSAADAHPRRARGARGGRPRALRDAEPRLARPPPPRPGAPPPRGLPARPRPHHPLPRPPPPRLQDARPPEPR